MANLKQAPVVTMSVELVLTEEEARALNLLASYNRQQMLDVFYQHLGSSLQEHEAGLVSFFDAARDVLPGLLAKLQKAKDAFK